MKAVQPIASDVRYVVGLVHAGMDGVISARKATNFPRVGWGPACVPAFIGAAVGATRASLGPNRRSGYGAAKGALLGSFVGLGCGVAWATRNYTLALARGARGKIGTAQDLRWLEQNPIDYA